MFLFTLTWLAACSQQDLATHELPSQSILLNDTQAVVIQINSGDVSISQSDGSTLKIDGTTNLNESSIYQVTQNENEIRIISDYKTGLFTFSKDVPLKINIQVPAKHSLTIKSSDAKIKINNYTGNLDVSTVSGVITAQNFSGSATLKSSRGNITFSDSNGELNLVGDDGLLSMENLHGMVSSSTVLGKIKFNGIINSGDSVHLETDRGPVQIQLMQGSGLGVQIRSTSGNATCLLPNLSVSPHNCDGVIGEGSGKLSVRTVSGDVTLQQGP